MSTPLLAFACLLAQHRLQYGGERLLKVTQLMQGCSVGVHAEAACKAALRAAVFSAVTSSHHQEGVCCVQAAASAQSKAVARERDDLRALNEQVLRNQAALRQQVASLQATQGSEAAHIKDLEEQVRCAQASCVMLTSQPATYFHAAFLQAWQGLVGKLFAACLLTALMRSLHSPCVCSAG